jgi:hypothetical protein
MWTIEMSTLRYPEDIKLKNEMDSYIINCEFIDPIIEQPTQPPAEQTQPPEQTQAPSVMNEEVASPQPSASDDDATPVPLPSNDADDIRRKLKEAWEQTYPTETCGGFEVGKTIFNVMLGVSKTSSNLLSKDRVEGMLIS